MLDRKLSPLRLIQIDPRGAVRCGLCRQDETFRVLEEAERWSVNHFAAWHPRQLPLLRGQLSPSKLCEDDYFLGLMRRMTAPRSTSPAVDVTENDFAEPDVKSEGFGFAPTASPARPSVEVVRDACRQLARQAQSEVFVASLKTLSALSRLSVPTVMKCRKRLIEEGWLVEVAVGSYRINEAGGRRLV